MLYIYMHILSLILIQCCQELEIVQRLFATLLTVFYYVVVFSEDGLSSFHNIIALFP